MNIGIIDADLLDNGTTHPNLVCEKISGFYKEQGHKVELLTDYGEINNYDEVFMSKVFNFTNVPIDVFDKKRYPNLHVGGTGFFWKASPNLPHEIEHHMPDYHLYNDYIDEQISKGVKPSNFKIYTDFSIGFTTRGCFRKCPFCVNEKYDRVFRHAPVSKFLDTTRPNIILWDDNILGYSKWYEVFDELNATGKRFQFKQGMDMRLMTDDKAKVISSSKIYGDYLFSFDNIKDKEIITKKLKLWQKYATKTTKMCVLTGFDSQDERDIANTFERVKVLMEHHCLPYIMRHENYQKSKYRGLYVTLARWCNQPNFFKKKSFREFCESNQEYHKTPNTLCAALKSLKEFEKDHPEIAKKYFDVKWI